MKRIIFVVLAMLCAAAVFADDMAMMSPVVAPDGTALIRKTTLDTTGGMMSAKLQTQLIAISSSGTVKWRYDTAIGVTGIAFSGDKVILLNVTATNSEVVALRLADGVVAWKTNVDGFAMGVEATSTQIYVTTFKGGVMVHGRPSLPAPGVMSTAVTLTALNPASGVVLWSVTP